MLKTLVGIHPHLLERNLCCLLYDVYSMCVVCCTLDEAGDEGLETGPQGQVLVAPHIHVIVKELAVVYRGYGTGRKGGVGSGKVAW